MSTRRFEYTVQLDNGLIIPAGAAAGKQLLSDVSGNATWKTVPTAYPNVLMSLAASSLPMPTGAAKAIGIAFRGVFQRAIVPVSGKLKDLSVFNGGTVAGETRLAIFDTGDAVAGKYTLLKQSAATVMAGAAAWQSFGALEEPSLTAGQHIMLAIMNSTTTATFDSTNTPIIGAATSLPAGYLPVAGGASPKLMGVRTFASLAYETITEAQLTGETTMPAFVIIGRIE